MACDFSLRTQAHFDGEADAVSATQVQAHVAGCAECQGLLHHLGHLRAALRQDVGSVRAPAALRSMVRAALDREAGNAPVPAPSPAMASAESMPASSLSRVQERRRYFWNGAVAGVTGSALAAGLALFLLLPPRVHSELDGIVSAHLRSMTPDHLVDVVSTDRHTVKPWFASHADVSPVVADFASNGYRLIGGRADHLNHQRAAVIVYRHGDHVINVFTWADDMLSKPRDALRNGYHLAFWTDGNLTYCAVSDADWSAVLELKGLIQRWSESENRR